MPRRAAPQPAPAHRRPARDRRRGHRPTHHQPRWRQPRHRPRPRSRRHPPRPRRRHGPPNPARRLQATTRCLAETLPAVRSPSRHRAGLRQTARGRYAARSPGCSMRRAARATMRRDRWRPGAGARIRKAYSHSRRTAADRNEASSFPEARVRRGQGGRLPRPPQDTLPGEESHREACLDSRRISAFRHPRASSAG